MSSLAAKLARLGTGTHVAIYRASKGRVGARMGGRELCLLTTTGRVSGRLRTTPLATFPHDDGLVVVASNGGSDRTPSWYHNLVAHPDVQVQTGDEVRAMVARTATAAEKAAIWPGIVAAARNFGTYQTKTDRNLPVVILSPAAGRP